MELLEGGGTLLEEWTNEGHQVTGDVPLKGTTGPQALPPPASFHKPAMKQTVSLYLCFPLCQIQRQRDQQSTDSEPPKL